MKIYYKTHYSKVRFHFLFFLFLLIIPGIVKSQTRFQQTYGSGYAYDIKQTADGGYVLGGANADGSVVLSYVIKTNSLGDTLWTGAYVDTCNLSNVYNGQYVNDIVQNTDHGYLICGGKGAVCNNNTVGGNVVRLDSNGNPVWAKYFTTSEDPYPCIQDKAGNFIVGGYETGIGAGAEDGAIAKLNPNGDTIWSRTFGGAQDEWFNHILQTRDGGYLAAGYTTTFGQGQEDIYLVKVDGNGHLLWSKTYGTSYNEYVFGHGMAQCNDGGYIITGQGSYPGTKNVLLMKVDSNGNLQWAKGIDGTYGHDVEQTSDGGYAIGGCWIGKGVELVKTDSAGNVQWAKLYTANHQSGAGFEGFFAVQANDGGYAVGGQTIYVPHVKTPYFIKTDASGISGCNDSVANAHDSVLGYIVTNPPTQVNIGANTLSYPVYRLSHADITTLCLVTGSAETKKMIGKLTIYPNPNEGSFTIKAGSGFGASFISIYNVLGENIYSAALNMQQGMNIPVTLTNAVSGVYLYRVLSGKGELLGEGKFVISK